MKVKKIEDLRYNQQSKKYDLNPPNYFLLFVYRSDKIVNKLYFDFCFQHGVYKDLEEKIGIDSTKYIISEDINFNSINRELKLILKECKKYRKYRKGIILTNIKEEFEKKLLKNNFKKVGENFIYEFEKIN